MRSIYRYHTVSRGWGDIGYNVIVDKFGRLWEGRYGGLASTVIGAHAGGFNTSTFGVSMLGNYDIVDAAAGDARRRRGHRRLEARPLRRRPQGHDRADLGRRRHREVRRPACRSRCPRSSRTGTSAARPARAGTPTPGWTTSGTGWPAQVDLHMAAIERRYAAEPALRADLGAAVGDEVYGDGWRGREYERTAGLYWSAHRRRELHARRHPQDLPRRRWPAGARGADDRRGAPRRTGELQPLRRRTRRSTGRRETGAQVVRGGIRARWMAIEGGVGAGLPDRAGDHVGAGAGREAGVHRGATSTGRPRQAPTRCAAASAAAWKPRPVVGTTLGLPGRARGDVPGRWGSAQDFSPRATP